MNAYRKYNNNDQSYEERVNYEDIYSMMGSMMTQAFSVNRQKDKTKKPAAKRKAVTYTSQ